LPKVADAVCRGNGIYFSLGVHLFFAAYRDDECNMKKPVVPLALHAGRLMAL
jgi:hypothetical protein